MPSVAQNTFFLTGALVIQKIISLGYFTVLARYLGVESLGKFSFALAFTTIFGVLADLGITQTLIRDISRNRDKTSDYIKPLVGAKFLLSGIAYGAALLGAFIFRFNSETITLIAFSGIVMFLDQIHLAFYGILRGVKNLWYEAVGMVVSQVVTITLGVVGVVLHRGLPFFMVVFIVASVFNVMWSWSALRKTGVALSYTFSHQAIVALLRLALPFAIAGVFTKIYSYIDIVLLNRIQGDIAAGFYSVAYKITYAFQFLPLALSAALYPALSAYWMEQRDRFIGAATRSFMYSMAIAMPLVLSIGFSAHEIIGTFFGATYIPSIILLQVSVAGLLLGFLYFPFGAMLNATFHQTANTIIIAITTILNVVLNLILVPRYSGLGASIAQVVANLFLLIASYIAVRRIVVFPRSLFLYNVKAVFAGGVMVATLLILKTWIWWPAAAILAVATFYGIMLALRALSPEDRKEIMFHLVQLKLIPKRWGSSLFIIGLVILGLGAVETNAATSFRTIDLRVPFTPQAPYANWSLPYQEACEEASTIMVDAFYRKNRLTKEKANRAILSLVEWEKKRFGSYEHTSAEETATILRERFGYLKARVVYDITIQDIKKELTAGHPTIVPAAGRLLGNPYFRQPGPVYHMLVVRGFTRGGRIITNDPGTKRGQGYLYDPDVLMNAIHDWNAEDITKGRKAMIVVEL